MSEWLKTCAGGVLDGSLGRKAELSGRFPAKVNRMTAQQQCRSVGQLGPVGAPGWCHVR